MAWVLGFAMLILMKIVCFVLGYLTVRLGHDLVRRGVTGDFKFSTSMGGFKADLASMSPGLLFVLLGVLLIGFAMWVPKEITLDIDLRARSSVPAIATPPD